MEMELEVKTQKQRVCTEIWIIIRALNDPTRLKMFINL